MKVKRFKNLWAMGLLLFGAILIAFYIAKIFFPQFIIGVAELPSIVKFGNYVNSHKWANHLFNIFTSFTLNYVYFCACCRTYKLNLKQFLVLVVYIITLRLISLFAPTSYTPINYLTMVLVPFTMCLVDKNLNDKTFVSTIICFSVDIITQLLSLKIRDIVIMSTNLNPATFFILLIDALIWRVLLYLYFNYKNKGE